MDSTPEPSWLAALVGGGSVLGVAISKGLDFFKARRMLASGDRRQAERGLGKLIDRLEKRLDATEKDARSAAKDAHEAALRLAECEHGHASCRTRLSLLTAAMNEMRDAAGMELLPVDEL